MEHIEQQPSGDRLYILDLDRCLIDTNLAQSLLERATYAVANIQPSVFQEERRRVEESGGSFNTLGSVREYVHNDPQKVRDIEEYFCEEARSRHGEYLLRQDGADELLELLETHKLTHFIMTYGSPDWQRLKLRASGLGHIPRLITDSRNKGLRIEESYDRRSGEYVFSDIIPGQKFHAPEICLIDDKAVSFEGLNTDRTKGFQVLPSHGEMLVSQMGELPSSVVALRGLRNVLAAIKASID